MTPEQKKRSYRTDLTLAGILVTTGLVMSGMSLGRLAIHHPQFAQATPPLQSTPGAESKPSAPSESTTTGSRPGEMPPQPARPNDDAQNAGATPALPPAPAEKIAAPIPAK